MKQFSNIMYNKNIQCKSLSLFLTLIFILYLLWFSLDKRKKRAGWASTKEVIKSRTRTRAFAGRSKKVENASDFRLFSESFTDENELSLNVLRVTKYLNNTRMKELARDNMPFMALEIHGLEEVTLRQVSIFSLRIAA